MENNQTNVNNTATAAKKHNTHFAISLTIIAVALVIACIIATVAIIGNLTGGGEGLSSDGKKLNGKTPDDIYSGFSESVEESKNYTVTLDKHGIATAIVESTTLSVDISMKIESMVEGDNFYYKKTTKTKYIGTKNDGNIESESVIEIRVVDNVAYINQNGEKLKKNVNTDEYKKSFDVLSEIIWEDAENLFAGGVFETVGDNFVVSATTFDKNLTANDARSFFTGEKSDWIWALVPVYSAEKYTVSYNADEKPVEASYSYTINDITKLFMSGRVGMEADISYGDAVVRRPSDYGDYVEITEE